MADDSICGLTGEVGSAPSVGLLIVLSRSLDGGLNKLGWPGIRL